MKIATYLLVCLSVSFIQAQQRYESPVFESTNKKTFAYTEELSLDVYQPEGDTENNRIALLLVHGGGFSGGQRDGNLESNFMKKMALRGYVGVSMSYRLLRKGKGFGCDCPAVEKETTFLEAAKDVYAATEYLKAHAEQLGINPEKIVLIGSSAGAEAVLNAAFMQQSPTYASALGDETVAYAGLVSFAGAVLDADLIIQDNAIPSLLFHGKKDKLVPFGSAPHHYCDSSDPGHIVLDGSRTISRKIRQQKVASQLVKDPKGNHDWANLPYKKTDLIASFIFRTLVNKQAVKKRIRIKN